MSGLWRPSNHLITPQEYKRFIIWPKYNNTTLRDDDLLSNLIHLVSPDSNLSALLSTQLIPLIFRQT
jgi:hypothetical protein